jgi:methionyl-tRNA formyltransferase
LFQPENLKNDSFKDELTQLNADIFIVVAFRMLPKTIWEIPNYGTINLHGSLLPEYRGAAPINWAVINGESHTGVTTFIIDEKIDTGEILLQKEIKINDGDNAGIVHDKLMDLGAQLILKTIDKFDENKLKPRIQTSSVEKLKTAYKLNRENTKINWNESSNNIRQLILGLSPYPSAWTTLNSNGKSFNFKIYDAILNAKKLSPGTIEINKNQFLVGTNDGSIELKQVQLEGKKRMDTASLINGNPFIKTSKLS